MLQFVCSSDAAGCCPSSSSSSPGPSSVLVIQKGQNVSLSCNLSSSGEVTWYLLRSEQLLPLLTQRSSKLSGGDTADVHSGNKRLGWAGAVESGQVSLEINEVQEEDAGLYFCARRLEASEHVNGGIQLTMSGMYMYIFRLETPGKRNKLKFRNLAHQKRLKLLRRNCTHDHFKSTCPGAR
uniref:Ig-like domain-containing protein n=1 Tax=Oryzias latipes TaxID=8090 RepID=A0A3B3HPP0_ORYLA